MNNLTTYWDDCMQIVHDNLSESAFHTWFSPIVPLQFENDVLTIQIPSQFFYEYIEENYIDLLARALMRVFGKHVQLEYKVLVDSKNNMQTTIPSMSEQPVQQVITTPYDRRPQLPDLDPQLNAQCTFQNYVEGECNKLARTAGINIAQKPGETIFNPLFVYGGSGVGKTHLVHAIGNMIKRLYPSKRVLYVPANTFELQYTNSVLTNKRSDFINFYQTIDVLIVDDIQGFAGKSGTQDTFFHIFNHLHLMGKQLIFTSDQSPVAIKDIDQRLIGRFKWGLTAEIKRPDFQLRKDILKSMVHRDGLVISDDVIDFIANNVQQNIRDLQGIIVSLLANSTWDNKPIDLKLAEQIVSRVVDINDKEITIDRIANTVCQYMKIETALIYSKSRKREIALARQISMYLSKRCTNRSLSYIGDSLGGRDHATVLHACKTIEQTMQYDAVLRKQVKEIEDILHT